MVIRKLAVMAAAASFACGDAGAQEKATYDKALNAVTQAGCERTEADSHIRYLCKANETLWYFTHEGRPEHATYFVTSAYSQRDPFAPSPFMEMNSEPGRLSASGSREQALVRVKAIQQWERDIIAVWRRDTVNVRPKVKRDSGKLYPIVP